jgi:hypothetical protein
MDKTQIFIEKAFKIHGDKYDYSKVEYINAKTKIIVICKIHGDFLQRPDSHLNKANCSKCSKIKQTSNSNEFIKKAELKHGNKYDYSKVNYIGVYEKVIIICKKHGEFEQIAHDHYKAGCNKCGGTYKSNTEEFIKKAKLKHGDKYDYSKVEYIKNNKNIMIFCKIHGEFLQTPATHLRSNGCGKCGGTFKSNTKEFIEKAKLIHYDKYDYSKVNYINNTEKIIIICKDHGEFLQSPAGHLVKKGCGMCRYITTSNKMTSNTEEFIEKAKLKHGDKYEYYKVNYINNTEKIIIICKDHGEFEQRPSGHLYGFEGCNKCNNNNFSKSQIEWLEILSKLNNINIQHAMNDSEFTIPNTKYKADGYCKENNTIYEFHGDYWHGNPQIFNPNELNKTVGKTHKELYKNTLKREHEIKDLGFNLEVMWESDWVKINKSIKKIQKKFRLKFRLN